MIIPEFSIVKYVPDLARMEPRNVGLIAWAEGGMVTARFLGETSSGKVAPPSVVPDSGRYAYRQWIKYWRFHLAAGRIRRRNGEVVEKTSPSFLEALQEKSKEGFRLVPSGKMTTRIKPTEFEDFASEMFSRLVEKEHSG